MKRRLQLVALAVAVLLALPPALAHELCLTARQDAANHVCCPEAQDVATTLAPSDAACGGGCCALSAPTVPPQNGVSPSSDAAPDHNATLHALVSPPLPAARSVASVATVGSSRERYLLLHVFRI